MTTIPNVSQLCLSSPISGTGNGECSVKFVEVAFTGADTNLNQYGVAFYSSNQPSITGDRGGKVIGDIQYLSKSNYDPNKCAVFAFGNGCFVTVLDNIALPSLGGHICLVGPPGNSPLEFISYGPETVTAKSGPCKGLTSTLIGVDINIRSSAIPRQSNNEFSYQKTGEALDSSDEFIWGYVSPTTPQEINTAQIAFVDPSVPIITFPYEAEHIFSVDDVIGGFDGKTFKQDPTILCGTPNSDGMVTACPEGIVPLSDKDDDKLYPIDSEFGFNVVDFLGAAQLERDDDYLEGFAGNIMDGPDVIGLKISNASTKTYKVKPPLGTWCQGLTATAVKCSTEHFSVMEHVLTCHETIPYQFADPDDGTQAIQTLITEDGDRIFDCTAAELDTTPNVIVQGEVTADEYNPSATMEDDPGFMEPNDNTDAQNNIATTSDYSITLKDDGKVLYRWGSLIKRPTDVRLYAKLPLPEEWKEPDADYTVHAAYLVIDHWITNNPNDQVRAEDLENEGATGRKPSYRVDTDGRWLSLIDCVEGDGDLIPGDEGEIDPDVIPSGTVFKQSLDLQGSNPPAVLSSDLDGKFTNAFYTTINRDPFEWSYRTDEGDENVYNFVGTSIPVADAEARDWTLVSGPRWRLKSNKFGQDLPGLDIPRTECSPPPYTMDNLKYRTGDRTETWINLLDWNTDNGPSPLATSKGWVDVTTNTNVETQPGVMVDIDGTEYPVSTNGLPMTDDFDLAIYIKGDKKPTAIYSAKLLIFDDVSSAPVGFNLRVSITGITPVLPQFGEAITLAFTITNDGPLPIDGKRYTVSYSDNAEVPVNMSVGTPGDIGFLTPGASVSFQLTYTPPYDATMTGNVNAKFVVQAMVDDLNPDDDKAEIGFRIQTN